MTSCRIGQPVQTKDEFPHKPNAAKCAVAWSAVSTAVLAALQALAAIQVVHHHATLKFTYFTLDSESPWLYVV